MPGIQSYFTCYHDVGTGLERDKADQDAGEECDRIQDIR